MSGNKVGNISKDHDTSGSDIRIMASRRERFRISMEEHASIFVGQRTTHNQQPDKRVGILPGQHYYGEFSLFAPNYGENQVTRLTKKNALLSVSQWLIGIVRSYCIDNK